MDLASLEQLAEDAYERNGFDPRRPTTPHRIARAEYKDPELIVRPRVVLGHRPSGVGWMAGRPRIMLRSTVPEDDEQFYVGHELAHLLLGRKHGEDSELEAACDYLGAALMAPRPAVRELYRRHGWNLRAIAREVVATQTWAALRLAETVGCPLAAVSPELVRVRGAEWGWPAASELRRHARRPGPGLKKVRITDRPARTVLLANL